MNGPIIISKMTLKNFLGFIYPVLYIDGANEDERYDTRYLMPFRLYKFQICETDDGEWDCGSSEVKHFKDIIKYANDPVYELKKQLCCCFNDYMNTSYGYPGRVVRYTFDNQMFRTSYVEDRDIKKKILIEEVYKIEELPYLDEFINETINSVKREYNIPA